MALDMEREGSFVVEEQNNTVLHVWIVETLSWLKKSLNLRDRDWFSRVSNFLGEAINRPLLDGLRLDACPTHLLIFLYLHHEPKQRSQ